MTTRFKVNGQWFTVATVLPPEHFKPGDTVFMFGADHEIEEVDEQ